MNETAGASGRAGRGVWWLLGLPLVVVIWLLFDVLPRARRLHLRLLPRERRVKRLLADVQMKTGWPRLLAIEDLGRLREARAVDLFIQALDSEDVAVAAGALLRFGPAVAERLVQAVGSPTASEQARRAGFGVLARLDVDVPVPVLLEALFGRDHETAEAARLISRRSPSHAVPTAIMGRLRAADGWTRVRAVELLGGLAFPPAAFPISELLRSDPVEHVRAAAVRALASLKPESLTEWLLPVVRDPDEDDGIRVEAATALAQVIGWSELQRIAGPERDVSDVLDEAKGHRGEVVA